MSFWNDVRKEVRERTTTADISTKIFKVITDFNISPLAVVEPTFYIGRCYILCFDYMDYVERLIECDETPESVFQFILYIRETAGTLGRCVRHAVGPVEEVLSTMDDLFEDHIHEEFEDSDLEEEEIDSEEIGEDEDRFLADAEKMAQEISLKLHKVGISEKVSTELAKRLAAFYRYCVLYVADLRELSSPDVVDMFPFMEIFMDIQYLMDTEMRLFLLEDVFVEGNSSYSTGIMPWISHSVAELVSLIGKNKE